MHKLNTTTTCTIIQVVCEVFVLCITAFRSADQYLSSGFLGWKSLLTIIEHLKDRTPKRGSDAGGLGALSKRVKSVNLGD